MQAFATIPLELVNVLLAIMVQIVDLSMELLLQVTPLYPCLKLPLKQLMTITTFKYVIFCLLLLFDLRNLVVVFISGLCFRVLSKCKSACLVFVCISFLNFIGNVNIHQLSMIFYVNKIYYYDSDWNSSNRSDLQHGG
jgi:hypothetical protein